MPRPKRMADSHPAWYVWLLLANDAKDTGITEAQAKAEIQRLFPTLAKDLDSAMEHFGDTSAMKARESALELEIRLNEEDHSAQMARLTGSTPTPAMSANEDGDDFSAIIRRQALAGRNTLTREVES